MRAEKPAGMGSTGNLPVPVGDPPNGMEKRTYDES